MKELVRKAYYREGKSKRQIARELGIHRDTVSRLLCEADGQSPGFKRQEWSYPVMGPFIPIIEAWLKEDETAPRKQQHTARRVFDRLVEEYQFPGSYRRVREVVITYGPFCSYPVTTPIYKEKALHKHSEGFFFLCSTLLC